MELTYDWKCFQSIFCLKKRVPNPTSEPLGTIYLITDKNAIVSLFSEGEELSEWLGASTDEFVAKFTHREILQYDRGKVDEWMSQAADHSHFHDQTQFLRTTAKSQLLTRTVFKNPKRSLQGHFLLEAIQTWWCKIFPSTYGIYISVEGGGNSSLLVIVKRGRVDSFQIPDFSSMIDARKNQPADRIKFLNERYLVPIQGLFVSWEEWVEWSHQENPWPQIGKVLKSNRNKLIPCRWGLVTMIASKAYLGM